MLLQELRHPREHRGKRFCALLDRVLPDWLERRQRLTGCAIR